jgi:hypothetical protein
MNQYYSIRDFDVTTQRSGIAGHYPFDVLITPAGCTKVLLCHNLKAWGE